MKYLNLKISLFSLFTFSLIYCSFKKDKVLTSCIQWEECYLDKIVIDSLFCNEFKWAKDRSFSIGERTNEIIVNRGYIHFYKKWIIDKFEKGLSYYGSPFLRLSYQNSSIDMLYPIFGYEFLHSIKESVEEGMKKGGIVDLSDYPMFLCRDKLMTVFFKKHLSSKNYSNLLMEFNQSLIDPRPDEHYVFFSKNIKANDYKIYNKEARDTLKIPKQFVEASNAIFISRRDNMRYNDYFINFWDKKEKKINSYYIKNGFYIPR